MERQETIPKPNRQEIIPNESREAIDVTVLTPVGDFSASSKLLWWPAEVSRGLRGEGWTVASWVMALSGVLVSFCFSQLKIKSDVRQLKHRCSPTDVCHVLSSLCTLHFLLRNVFTAVTWEAENRVARAAQSVQKVDAFCGGGATK